MDDGILAKRSPFFFSYSPVGVTHQVDTISWLKHLFGNKTLDSGSDPMDGLKLGFVSEYAMKDAREDFAESFNVLRLLSGNSDG